MFSALTFDLKTITKLQISFFQMLNPLQTAQTSSLYGPHGPLYGQTLATHNLPTNRA